MNINYSDRIEASHYRKLKYKRYSFIRILRFFYCLMIVFMCINFGAELLVII